MCRILLYQGPPILLSKVLIEPSHSLIRQSTSSREREEPLNGDGFGVGWYATGFTDVPAVFRSITPAWNNRNLHNLARVVVSRSIFAHVRAATQSSGVNEANCHPFRFENYLFMHNGDIGNFRQIRRRLLESVCDEAFNNVYGSTDSEHFFAVIIDELKKRKSLTALNLARAVDASIKRVIRIVNKYGEGVPSYINIAIGNGKNAVITRYTSAKDANPESLYWYSGHFYQPLNKEKNVEREIIVSSERLTREHTWQPVPRNHMVIIEEGKKPVVRPIGPSR